MKKLILLVVVLLTFVACQKEDISTTNEQTEIYLKVSDVDIKAGYTNAEWDEIMRLYEASKFQTKRLGDDAPPDDLEFEGYYVVVYGYSDFNVGRQMLAYFSPSTGEVWGVIWEGSYNSGFKKIIYGTAFPGYLYSWGYKPVQL